MSEPAIHALRSMVDSIEREHVALRARLAEVEAENQRLRVALRFIEGPASDGDPYIEHYRAAGGGYEGLQAVAQAAFGG